MGNSLHNKIYLGRRTDTTLRAMIYAGAVAGLGLLLWSLRALK
ncbi:hypothetical protein [Massilia endophytica]|nr:hypothetical protein [Massilia endophytica]